MSIRLEGIRKNFGSYRALDNVDLEVGKGELLALLGPSGCGKTTLLRVIAGLELPDAGTVLLDGQDTTRQSVQEKSVGFVFQHYALFPHLSVYENVAFGLRVLPRQKRPARQEIKAAVMELLGLVQMAWAADRLPAQLSGGQRQRIALARALAVKPRVLLLDEPFSALDAKVRLELRRWLRKLHDDLHITSVFVTHDQEEALELADRVVIVNKGKIEQQGSPQEVYDHPANAFVFNFLGNVNIFHGRVADGRLPLGALPLPVPHDQAHLENLPARVFVRPHQVEVLAHRPADGQGLEARISEHRLRGGIVHLELDRLDGEGSFAAELPRQSWQDLDIARDSTVWVRFRETRFFEPDDYVI